MTNKVAQVLQQFDITEPWFYEAFVDQRTGKLDFSYLCAATGEDLSVPQMKAYVKEITGSETYEKQYNESSITKDEFFEIYECAHFLMVKDWIRYLWLDHGILVTKADLFDWVSNAHPPKVVSYTDFTNFERSLAKKGEYSE